MNKKIVVGLAGLLVVAGLGIGAYFVFGKGKGNEEGPLPTPTPEKYLEVGVEESPFISVTPTADGHWLNIGIERIQDAETIEYELAYETADGVNQGAIGGPYPVPSSGVYTKKILLGTESSGHYTYHEGVKDGSLTVRLGGGKGPRKFVADFALVGKEDELVSSDGQFAISEAKFGSYLVIMPTFGLPAETELAYIGEPYGVFSPTSTEVALKDIQFGDGELLSWNGKRWVEASEAYAILGMKMAFLQRQ